MKNDKIEQTLQKMVDEDVFPGANYLLIAGNDCYMGSVGNKSLYPNVEPNSVDTLYDLASLTKVVVTNTITTKLLAKQKLHLEDKVCSYLPRFKYHNITILDLLTHSSGLASDLSWRTVSTKEQLLDNLYNLELLYNPGEKVVYSDIGFILMGLIIEKIYDCSIDEVAKKEVFTPLGMFDTYYNPVDKEKCAPTEVTSDRGIVRGTVHDEKTELLGGVAGHAGVFSTVNDIAKFLRMIQNNGKIGNQTYIPKEYIDLWFKPYRQINKEQYRSMGWIVGKSENITGELGDMDTIYHTGFTGNHIIINREKNMYGVLLSNRVHPTRDNKKLISRRKDFLEVCLRVIYNKKVVKNS